MLKITHECTIERFDIRIELVKRAPFKYEHNETQRFK